MRALISRLIPAVAMCGWATSVLAQDAAAPVFATEVEVVKVTATAWDDAGRLVTDLERSDFRLFDDGEEREILFFARSYEPGRDEELALDVGLLMDTSESMLEMLQLSQRAVVRFLDSVPRARDLVTVFFDQDIRLSRYDNEHQQGLIRRIHAAKGGGNTALYDAIVAYLSRVYGIGGRQVMVIFSDGEDSISTTSAGEVYDLVRSSNVTIFPIAITDRRRSGPAAMKSRVFFHTLADISGGEVSYLTLRSDLGSIYDEILDQLAAQYVIGFAPAGGADPDHFRKLKLEVARDVKIRHRKGYYPSPPVDGT